MSLNRFKMACTSFKLRSTRTTVMPETRNRRREDGRCSSLPVPKPVDCSVSIRVSGLTILVGHSYGGAVITNAGTGAPNLHSLVYIAAVAPDEGESVMGIAKRFPTPPTNAHIVPSYRQGYNWIDPAFFPQDFVQDIAVAQARALAVVQKPITPACFTAKSGPPAWKKVPSWYLVSGNDRVINVDSDGFLTR